MFRRSIRAGIDIAKDVHYAALPADWLEAHSIRQVAPEPAGVCRIASCEVLERRGFEAGLVDPVGPARSGRRGRTGASRTCQTNGILTRGDVF